MSQHLLDLGTNHDLEDSLQRQFRKLLLWLQNKLPAERRRLLQLVALFREPVPTATLAALAKGLDAMKGDFGNCDAAHLRYLLDALVRDHLLQREEAPGSDTARWSAHPIVRDVFRSEALAAGDQIAQQFARIVAGKGEGRQPQTVGELQPILEAIEVLLAAGDFKAADDLYQVRLSNGRPFLNIPAPQSGLNCARGFLEPPERRAALEQSLLKRRVGFYLNEVALFGSILGEMDGVERGYEEVRAIRHNDDDWLNVSSNLINTAEAQTLRGALAKAVASASEALFYAGVAEAGQPSLVASEKGSFSVPPKSAKGSRALPAQAKSTISRSYPRRPAFVPAQNTRKERDSLARRGNALALAGELSAASRDFAAADTLERKNDSDNDPLFSNRGIGWCRHRLRLGEEEAVRLLTEANRAICESHRWNNNLAQCDLLLAELDLAAGDRDSAERRISATVRVFREARQGKHLPEALLAQARLRGNIEDCEEALRLVSKSGFALMQCDALNVHARLRREEGQPEKAMNDARKALEIAEQCGYYWGRHEALYQLRDATKALGKRADTRHWDEAEKALAAKMQPEIEEALRINREHDAEMEKLYGKKTSGKA